MASNKCAIIFDNSVKTYYAGQTVNGKVELVLDKPKRVKCITIKFRGGADTSWSESESYTDTDGSSQTRSVWYTGHEEYFCFRYNLMGESELPPGKHSFDFTCALPRVLPSSFESKSGHIRYTIKVTLERPWKFDQATKVAFTVLSAVDLNLMPNLTNPIKRFEEKHFCCFCCASGPLSMTVSLPVTGYVPGQSIPVTAVVVNRSYLDILSVEFSLRKETICYTTSRSSSDKSHHTISKSKLGPVPEGDSREITTNIVIPPLAVSVTNCSIIELKYFIRVNLNSATPHRDLGISIPIVLGTIPLVAGSPNGVFVRPPEYPTAGDGSSSSTQRLPKLEWPYPSIPPPTYAESEYGTKSIQEAEDTKYTNYENDNKAYSPRYPFYNFQLSEPDANMRK